MKKLTEVLKFNGYETGICVDTYNPENRVKLFIENGELVVKKDKDKLLSRDEIDKIVDIKSFLEDYTKLFGLYSKEKRKTEKLLLKAELLKEELFLKDWSNVKDLRTKVANELKEKTIKKLKDLGKKLEEETDYTYFNFPKPIYFYDYGEPSGKYDERVILVWTRNWGYTLEVEEYNGTKWVERDEYSDAESTEFESITTGDNPEFEKMSKKNIKKIAKYIDEFETNITMDLNNSLSEEMVLLNEIDKLQGVAAI